MVESFVELGGAVVGGQGGGEGAEPGELGDGQPVESEAEQVVGLVGVLDLFLEFVQDVAVEEPGEQTGGVQRAGLVEPGGAEQLDQLLEELERAQRSQGERARQWPGQQQRHHVGVGQGDPAERVRGAVQDRFPIPVPVAVGLAGRDEFGGDVLDDAVEQGVLVRGVPVDRHRVAVEGLPEPAHGQRLDALGVDDRYGGGEDLLAGQRGPSPGRWCGRRAGLISVVGHQIPFRDWSHVACYIVDLR